MTTTFPPNYVAWYLTGDEPASLNCWKDWTFSTSGSLANCVTSGGPIITACDQSKNDDPAVLLYDDGFSKTCSDGFKCQTAFIMDTSPTGSPVLTEYFCERTWLYPSTLYRRLPPSVSVTTSADSQPTNPARTPTKTASSTPASATPSSTESSAENSAHGESAGLSGGAIAGIVIGVVAAIVLAALIFLRKKLVAWFGKKESTAQAAEPERGPTELSTQHEIHEIGSSGPHFGLAARLPKGDRTVSEIGSST